MNPTDLVTLSLPDNSSVIIHLHGAHVLSWKDRNGQERLFMSQAAIFQDGTPIRGGVPVVFPQFSGLGTLPKHGFARIKRWQISHQSPSQVTLTLADDETTRAAWPHAFKLNLTVTLASDALTLELEAHNPGQAPYDFTAALHTYLACAEATTEQVTGLQGLSYKDSVTGEQHQDDAPAIAFGTDIDRAYHAANDREVRLADLHITQTGFPDTVVWNPGPATAAKIPDLHQPEGWRSFVCVESAAVAKPVTLEPSGTWCGKQVIRVVG